MVGCAWQNLNDQAVKSGLCNVYAVNAELRETDVAETMSQVGF